MNASRYQQGRAKEYIAIEDLAAMGYTEAMRAAQSRGTADVICWNEKAIRFVQIKGYKDYPGNFTADIVALMNMQLPPYGSAELWLRQTGRVGWVERILIRHTHPEIMDLPSLDDLGREIKFTISINPDRVTELANSLKAAAKTSREKWKTRHATNNSTAPPTTTVPAASRRAPSSSRSPTTAAPAAGKTAAPPNGQVVATSVSPAAPPPAAPDDGPEFC